MLNFQDLPEELVLKILSYSETKHLIACGQVSKRIRRISQDVPWRTVNLEKKIVKTELLEMILSKGCEILNLRHCTIVGRLSSNIKSQLKFLNFQSCSTWIDDDEDDEETPFLEELLSSCCSLQHLVIGRLSPDCLSLTPKMATSICRNGKTLQILNMDSILPPRYGGSYHVNYFQEIIRCCQELKEVDLGHEDIERDFNADLDFLVRNISPNIEKLRYLSGGEPMDHNLKILLRRCNKIKALSLEETTISDELLANIRQFLNLTLEELSFKLRYNSLSGFLELKSMPRLKTLKLYTYSRRSLTYSKKINDEKIQNLKKHLPHLMIKVVQNK